MMRGRWSWLVVAATLWAAVIRLYRLDHLPPQAWVDEIWFNLRARDLVLTGDWHVFYRTFWGGAHPLMVDLTAMVQGVGLQGLVAARLVAALAGVVTIPLACVATNELWRATDWSPARRRITAALVAVILSSLFYLIVSSRVGYEPALIPPFMLFYIWQARRAQTGDRWLSWILAGAALGAAQYISLNGRFLAVLAVALGLHDLAVSPPSRRRSIFLGLCVAAGTCVLVALPLIVFLIREPQWVLARAGHVTAGLKAHGLPFVLDNAVRIAASLSFAGDLDARHNLPGRPMLDGLQSIGFLVGIVWALRNFRRQPVPRELLGWLALTTLPSLFTDAAPHFVRMIAVGVPAAALVAIGWVELWTWWQRIRPARAWGPHPAAGLLAIACVGTSTGLGVYDYFVRYPRTPGLATALSTFPVELARDLIARSRTETVFVERLTEAEDVYAFDFLMPGTAVRRLDFRRCLPLTDRRATRTTYLVFDERDPGALDRLRRGYPQIASRSFTPHAATLMDRTVLLEIAADTGAPAFQHPAHGRFARGLTLLGYDTSARTVPVGERVALTVYWKVAAEPGAADLVASLHLASRDGAGVVARSESPACHGLYPPAHWRPGDVIPTHFALAIPADVAPGDYPVAVGWSEWPSRQPLSLLEADGRLPDDRVQLTTVAVVAR